MSVAAARCLLLALGCVLALAAAPRRASAEVSAASAAVQAEIDAAVEKERAVYGGKTPVPGVLVGVWDGSGGSYIRAFGDADLATGRRLTPADHFRIGSNTKTFVVSVLLQLVDEGKLSLDDPLSRFSLGVTVPNQGLRMKSLSPADPRGVMTCPRDGEGAGHVDRESRAVFRHD
jgi:CubicO group peptidase (beta-lactamase class C family)